jgi:hypothetical protein
MGGVEGESDGGTQEEVTSEVKLGEISFRFLISRSWRDIPCPRLHQHSTCNTAAIASMPLLELQWPPTKIACFRDVWRRCVHVMCNQWYAAHVTQMPRLQNTSRDDCNVRAEGLRYIHTIQCGTSTTCHGCSWACSRSSGPSIVPAITPQLSTHPAAPVVSPMKLADRLWSSSRRLDPSHACRYLDSSRCAVAQRSHAAADSELPLS